MITKLLTTKEEHTGAFIYVDDSVTYYKKYAIEILLGNKNRKKRKNINTHIVRKEE
jgi:hypothetical protein